MSDVFQHDWKHSETLDLTDEGLAEEMAKHGIVCADKLAIDPAS
jgi:hypothetical protein